MASWTGWEEWLGLNIAGYCPFWTQDWDMSTVEGSSLLQLDSRARAGKCRGLCAQGRLMPVLAFSWLDDRALPKGLQLSRTGWESALQSQGSRKSELKIVLVGRTGAGKSATGNTILGGKCFESKIAAESVTTKCTKKMNRRDGRNLVVVDTPGLFDTQVSLNESAKEIGRCVVVSSPGPHAIIQVMQLGRFTEEEKETVARIQDIFGEEAVRYMIFLFTRKEDLQGRTLENFLKEVHDKDLQQLLDKCGRRCLAFSNKATGQEQRKQVCELLRMIDAMVEKNGGGHYTNDMYECAQRRLQQKMEELRSTYTEQMEREREEKKSQMDEEHKKVDEELRERIEELKKRGSVDQNTLSSLEQAAREKKEAIQQEMGKELQEISDRYQKLLNNLREEADKDASIIAYILQTFESTFSRIKNWFK